MLKKKFRILKKLFRFSAIFLLVAVFGFSNLAPVILEKFGAEQLAENLKIKEALAAAPTLQGSSLVYSALTTASVTPVLPAHQVDDILLAMAWIRTITGSLATPTGWTAVNVGGTTGAVTSRYHWFWKRAVSTSETNPVIAVAGGATGDKYAQVHVIRGVITTETPYEASQFTTGGIVDPGVATGVTALGDDRLIVLAGGEQDNVATQIVVTATNPASLGTSSATSNRYDVDAGGVDGAGFIAAAAQTSPGGATGNITFDFNATPDGWGVYVFAFKPPPPPAGPDATSYTNGTEAALNFSACATTGCGGRIGQAITVTGTAFGTITVDADQQNCAGGANTGCVRIANYTVPGTSISTWSDTSIVFTIPSGITVFGGASATCAGADPNGLCVTAVGVNDTNGALQFWVAPDITSISPSSVGEGQEGASVTITGTRFSATAGTVRFQNCAGADVTGTVGTWTDTSIAVTVPAGIADNDDLCDVRMVKASQSISAASSTDVSIGFIVLPDVTSMAVCATCVTNAAREFDGAGDTDGLIMLNGNHFGTTAGSVTFTGPITFTVHATAEGACTVGGWAAAGTSVCVEVSNTIANTTYTGTVTLDRGAAGGTDTDTISLRILPQITSNSPTTGVVGTRVKIAGDHFCQSGTCPVSPNRSAASDNVKFGSTQAVDADFVNSGAAPCSGNVQAWTDTEVCVNVPSATPTGAQATIVRSGAGACPGATCYESNTQAFTVPSTIPDAPTSLQQFASAGGMEIAVGGAASSTTLVLEGDISAGTSITMALNVEVKAIATAFNGVVTATSTPVTGTSAVNQQVTVSGLVHGTQYHWRARTINTTTFETSAWVAFGANPTGDGTTDGSPANTDFLVDTAAPAITTPSESGISDTQATINWNTDENATRQVAYGTTCPASSGQGGFGAFSNREPSAPSAVSTSPHSVTLSGLSVSTTYQYRIRASDSAGNAAFLPADTTCRTFATTAAQTRIMKTLDVFIQQATTTPPVASLTNAFPAVFDVFIAESNTLRTNITIRSAFVEVFGISSVTSGDITAGVNFQSGLTPTGNTTYTVSPGGTASVYWSITKQATGLNWDCSGCTDVSNTLDVTVSGTGVVNSMVGARMYVTYNYVP